MKKIFYLLFFVALPLSSLFSQTGVEISTEKVIIDGQKFYMHTVAQGNTLYSVSKAYGVKEADLKIANPEIGDSPLKLGQVLKIPVVNEVSSDGKHILYTVKPGDTLYSLCRKYGVTEVDFYSINPDLKQGKALKVGQEIKFPYAVVEDKINQQDKDTSKFHYHLVEKGETVYGLTRTYQVTKEELMAANPDFDGVKLLVGDVLRIPKKDGLLINENNPVIDSLANINFIPVDTTPDPLKVCEESNWFKNGKNFEVVILLPFEVASNMRNLYNQATANRDQRLYISTEKVISFYSGCLIALEKFKNYDIKINLKVYDTGKDNSMISKLIEDNKLSSADMIIGPAFKSQIDFLNTNLNNSEAVVLIPFVSESGLIEKYEQNICLRPSLDMIIDGIASYAALNPINNYFVIQGNSPEQIRVAETYEAALREKIGPNANVSRIMFGGKDLAGVKTLVSKEKENVFILPFNTETSCTNIFLDLYPLKDYSVTLIGDPAIMEYETIDPSYYSKVKFTYFSGVNIDYSDTETQKFLADYRASFLCEPDENAFIAYDAVSYFFLKLIRHGNQFCPCIPTANTHNGISGHQKYESKSNFATSSFSNSTVYIFQMQEDFSFEKVFPVAAE
jgi:LysM repeat protein